MVDAGPILSRVSLLPYPQSPDVAERVIVHYTCVQQGIVHSFSL